MTESQKTWIDNASYHDLLQRWRFAPIGDPMFVDDTGEYFAKAMETKRKENPEIHVKASKDIGWGD